MREGVLSDGERSRIIAKMKDIEPEFRKWDDKDIFDLIKVLYRCGYKWKEDGQQGYFKHSEKISWHTFGVKFLYIWKPEEIIEAYEETWKFEMADNVYPEEKPAKVLLLIGRAIVWLEKRIGL